ncbi:unnamed protein product [Mucor hiemalis]
MPTALTETQHHPILMRPSFSTNTTLPRFVNNNSKMSTPITRATVVSFEKKQSDQKIWYTIRVEPLASKKYFISRRYEDFSQFSQKLYDRFNTTKYRAGSRLPPKIKNRLQLLPTGKQIHAQRVQELNQFLSVLFQKQSIVTDSYIVMEFFGNMPTPKIEMMEEDGDEQENINVNAPTSRWKRLRCTSFLGRSPPSPTSTTSTSSTTANLSSLCSQAANKIIPSWNRNNAVATPQPSLSTPTHSNKRHLMTLQHQQTQQHQPVQGLKKSKSSLGIYSSTLQHPLDTDNRSMTITPSISSSITTTTSTGHRHQIKSTIKIKVIYDVENIIVIQVPRSITLEDLRSRIAQKFSDPSMGGTVHVEKEVVLLFSDNSSSCCSIASNHLKNNDMVLPAVLINKEQDLTQIMHTKWNRLEKVTLRCIM